MNHVAIEVCRLSKRYRLGSVGARTFREGIERWWNGRKRAVSGGDTSAEETRQGSIWALRDVSFQVLRGEILGIVGGNGAGKSTLLKILTRITEPTSGRAVMRGRISSLLEVGTGFHPELTGRENVYLNGALLGMKKTEIDRKFDEIVEFSGVGEFIDTPVKRYSSGMGVRLAFSVAAQLEPEIMLVDEVLAVGDVSFQEKCLGKMKSVVEGGRTVLFVSHNMSAILNLCPQSLYLVKGRVAAIGPSADVVAQYLNDCRKIIDVGVRERTDRTGNGKLRFTHFEVVEPRPTAALGRPCRMRIHYEIKQSGGLRDVLFSIGVNRNRAPVMILPTEISGANVARLDRDGHMDCVVERLPLVAGLYTVNLYCTERGEIVDYLVDAAEMSVDDSGYFASGRSPKFGAPFHVPPHHWESADG